MLRPRIRLERALYDRLKQCAASAGYSSADEFIRHALEKEIDRLERQQQDDVVADRLRGLGYLS